MNTRTLCLTVSLALPTVGGAADLTSVVTTDPVVIEAMPLMRAPSAPDAVARGWTAALGGGLPAQAANAADGIALSRPSRLGAEKIATDAAIAVDPTPARAARVSEVVLQALSLLGTPYRWGGDSTDHGFDCSGLVRHVIEQALGLVLPRSAIAMSRLGAHVERPRLQPGDLLFFVTRRTDVSHVGIYVGDGRFVHANRSGGEVTMSSLENKYWASRLVVARRVESQ